MDVGGCHACGLQNRLRAWCFQGCRDYALARMSSTCEGALPSMRDRFDLSIRPGLSKANLGWREASIARRVTPHDFDVPSTFGVILAVKQDASAQQVAN
jgi:hypothetical protein